jgi:hypothetical protein
VGIFEEGRVLVELAILGTALALFILEFDRMPGLRGLHRRVTGRTDMDEEDQS